MKKYFFLFFIFLTICSCTQSSDKKNESNNNNNENKYVGYNRCDTISSEEVYELKDLLLNISKDDELFTKSPFDEWDIRYKAVENRHNPVQTDTIYTLKKSNSFLEIYKVNSGKSILYKFKVNSQDYGYLENISVDEIHKRVNSAEINCNILILESPEVPSYLTFTFSENKIIEVNFNGYLD